MIPFVGEQIDVEVTDIADWQPNERVAQQFQIGRVFRGCTPPPSGPRVARHLPHRTASGRTVQRRQSLHGPAAELLDLGPDAPKLLDEKPIFALELGYQ